MATRQGPDTPDKPPQKPYPTGSIPSGYVLASGIPDERLPMEGGQHCVFVTRSPCLLPEHGRCAASSDQACPYVAVHHLEPPLCLQGDSSVDGATGVDCAVLVGVAAAEAIWWIGTLFLPQEGPPWPERVCVRVRVRVRVSV